MITKFKAFLFAAALALSSLAMAFSASAAVVPSQDARNAVAVFERSSTLETVWGVIQQAAAQSLFTEAEKADLVAVAKATQAAIEAGDLRTADEGLATLFQYVHDASVPKQKS